MNLDRLIDRRGTASLKWDFQKRLAGQEGLLPLWVADMDFPAPRRGAWRPCGSASGHGIFGYTLEPESCFQAAADWTRAPPRLEPASANGYSPAPGWCPPSPWPSWPSPRRATSVVIQPPVYYPFAACIRGNGREVLENPLRLQGGALRLDLEHLERASRTAHPPAHPLQPAQSRGPGVAHGRSWRGWRRSACAAG